MDNQGERYLCHTRLLLELRIQVFLACLQSQEASRCGDTVKKGWQYDIKHNKRVTISGCKRRESTRVEDEDRNTNLRGTELILANDLD